MYIAQVYNVLHDWWRYVVGFIGIIIGVFVFSMPHVIAIIVKQLKGEVDESRLDDVSYIMSLFESNLNLVFILLPFVGGLIFLFLVAKFIHKQSITHLTTSRKKIDWKRIWFSFVFWGIISTALVFLDIYLSPNDYVFNFNLQPFLILSVIAILLVPLQTSCEEYIFRGYLMQGIGVSTAHRNFPIVLIYSVVSIFGYIYFDGLFSFGTFTKLLIFIVLAGTLTLILNLKALSNFTSSGLYTKLYSVLKRNSTPLIITSLVFGLMHISNPEVDKLGPVIMVYYIGTGFFLGIMALMDEGIELSLGFHAANNLFTALLVTADWTAFQTHSIYKDISNPETAGFLDVFMPVFIMFPLLLFIFSKVYKWTNWKEKLFGKIEEPQKEDYKILE